MAKTIRFGDLVRESGRPEAVTLWLDPKKDTRFSKAVRENRVVTIHTHTAGKGKDYGQIGFQEERGATYLVFPRTLPKQSDSRIVGINYQLAEDAPVKGPLARPHSAKNGRRKEKSKDTVFKTTIQKPEAKEPKPAPKQFNVVVRRTAVVEDVETVKAFTEEQARQRALQSVRHKRLVLSRAVQREEVLSVNERK